MVDALAGGWGKMRDLAASAAAGRASEPTTTAPIKEDAAAAARRREKGVKALEERLKAKLGVAGPTKPDVEAAIPAVGV